MRKIEKNVPPESGRKYSFEGIEKGDSFLCDEKEMRAFKMWVYRRGGEAGKFMQKKQPPCQETGQTLYRVWLI